MEMKYWRVTIMYGEMQTRSMDVKQYSIYAAIDKTMDEFDNLEIYNLQIREISKAEYSGQ